MEKILVTFREGHNSNSCKSIQNARQIRVKKIYSTPSIPLSGAPLSPQA